VVFQSHNDARGLQRGYYIRNSPGVDLEGLNNESWDRYSHSSLSGQLCGSRSIFRRFCLPLQFQEGNYSGKNAAYTYEGQNDVGSPKDAFVPTPRYRHGSRIGDVYGGLILGAGIFVGIGFECWAVAVFCGRGSTWHGWILAVISTLILGVTIASADIGCFPGSWHRCLCDQQDHSEQREPIHRDGKKVAQAKIENNFDCIAVLLRPSDLCVLVFWKALVGGIGGLMIAAAISLASAWPELVRPHPLIVLFVGIAGMVFVVFAFFIKGDKQEYTSPNVSQITGPIHNSPTFTASPNNNTQTVNVYLPDVPSHTNAKQSDEPQERSPLSLVFTSHGEWSSKLLLEVKNNAEPITLSAQFRVVRASPGLIYKRLPYTAHWEVAQSFSDNQQNIQRTKTKIRLGNKPEILKVATWYLPEPPEGDATFFLGNTDEQFSWDVEHTKQSDLPWFDVEITFIPEDGRAILTKLFRIGPLTKLGALEMLESQCQ
jgi:hypothetical protein